MNGELIFKVGENNKNWLGIKVEMDLSIFNTDYNGDYEIELKALGLESLYYKYSSISSDKQSFAGLITKMFKLNYINNEVIATLKAKTQNVGMRLILFTEFPEIKPSEKFINKNDIYNEISSKLMKYAKLENEIVEIFKNIKDFGITEEGLKENFLYDIYKQVSES